MTEAIKTFLRSALALAVLLLALSLAIIAFDTEEPWHERSGTERYLPLPEHSSSPR